VKFEIVPAAELSLAEQAKVFSSAFTGYVGGSFELSATSLAAFVCSQGIDLCYSRFARSGDGELVSFGYINRTGGISRLAGMGTVPEARRSGAAAFALSSLLEEARERGDAAMVLEVIEQNPAALRLYQTQGFQEFDRLIGWRGSDQSSRTNAQNLREIPLVEAMRLPSNPDYPALPWQVSGHAAAKVAKARAYTWNGAAIVIGDTTAPSVRLHAYLGSDGTNWETLRQMTQMLLGRFPGREFHAPPIFPEQFGTEIFSPLAFEQEKLTQFLMRKDL
jgi:GNAT superfamily N-acetyltransferase